MKIPKPQRLQPRWILGILAGALVTNTVVPITQAQARQLGSCQPSSDYAQVPSQSPNSSNTERTASPCASDCPPSPGYMKVPSPIADFPNPDRTVFCGEDRVILTYGPFQVPILVSELKNFAETGEMTKTISQIVKASKMEPDTLRGLMTLEVGFDLVPFTCIISSPEGQELTDTIGTTIRLHRGKPGIPNSTAAMNGTAIRAALINALSADGKLSFLDIVSYYPVPGMYVDVANIPETVDKVKGLAGNLDSLFKKASQFGKGGCSLQEVDFPAAPPAPPPTPRPPLPPPLPPPPPPVAPPPVRGLW
jgi:U5 snRNP spliceosome subunit